MKREDVLSLPIALPERIGEVPAGGTEPLLPLLPHPSDFPDALRRNYPQNGAASDQRPGARYCHRLGGGIHAHPQGPVAGTRAFW